MRRFILILLVLTLLMLAGICAVAEENMFANCSTLEKLFAYADDALQDGVPANEVIAAMSAWAEEQDVMDELTWACENIAATAGKDYQKMLGYARDWPVDVWRTSPASEDKSNKWTAYTLYEVSDKMKAMLLRPESDGFLSRIAKKIFTRGDEKTYGLDNSSCPKRLTLCPCGNSRSDGFCEANHSPCVFKKVVELAAEFNEMNRLD